MDARVKNVGRFAFEDMPATVGQEGRPAVVLMHAWPMSRVIWRDAVAAMGDRPRILLPDLPGFGEAGRGGPFSIAGVASELRDALAELDALPAVIGGVSMGGYVALAFVAQFAADVAGLILCDTRADADPPANKAARQATIDLCRKEGVAAVAASFLPRMISSATAKDSERAQKLVAIMSACPAQTLIASTEALRDLEDRRGILGQIACPTLVLVGQEDSLTPVVTSREMAEKVRRAKLVIVPKAGHMAIWEQPVVVGERIGRFLREAAL